MDETKQTMTILPPITVTPNTTFMMGSYGSVYEFLWQTEFQNLFCLLPHPWTLSPTALRPFPPPEMTLAFFEHRDSAKVRFLCKKCGQGWTSMKGCVYFWCFFDCYGNGLVLFELLGQKCQKCNDERFESPLWYPEEVIKVLKNIYNKVCHTFYGLIPTEPYEKKRRPGKPRSQHPKELCQACQLGYCAQKI